eukprot:CAMPEP_0181320966 /NCGR_PEP_ID=MMETSP1101-20121128/18417_1 /TAXON_ID=46948 /ORGANISM="Rhodomonas abbreviata, Strain Caron Lab Isolate" /LENGTH=72 /DNA_ID=CAMNT_0023428729 /DNA_START=182 /DNA_END=400 /DNA_ORIENTATION=+
MERSESLCRPLVCEVTTAPSQSEYFAARAAHNRVVGVSLLPEKQICERTRCGRAVGAWLHEEARYGSDEEEL